MDNATVIPNLRAQNLDALNQQFWHRFAEEMIGCKMSWEEAQAVLNLMQPKIELRLP